jgi:hypothetical protein
MKPLITMILLLTLVGCSTIKPVSVVTDEGNWTVGQHDYCVYKTGRLLCVPSGSRVTIPKEMVAQHKEGEKYKIEDSLFANSFDFVSRVEEGLMKSEKRLQVKVFDTKFSAKPDDYSIWNCITTGLGSPAVECKLMKQPDVKGKELIANKLEQQRLGRKASGTLHALSHKMIEERCGAPLQRTEDSISVAELYKGESKLLAFHFNTLREDKLSLVSSMNSPPTKLDHKSMLDAWDGDHGWMDIGSSSGRENAAAIWILKEMPCLEK